VSADRVASDDEASVTCAVHGNLLALEARRIVSLYPSARVVVSHVTVLLEVQMVEGCRR